MASSDSTTCTHRKGALTGLRRTGFAFDGEGIRFECPKCGHMVILTRCIGIKPDGWRCKNMAIIFPAYCQKHAPDQSKAV